MSKKKKKKQPRAWVYQLSLFYKPIKKLKKKNRERERERERERDGNA